MKLLQDDAFGIGQAVPRKEDARLLKGLGSFTDDINLEHQVYAAFVRSPRASARIRLIDAEAARSMPGVLAIITGLELASEGIGTLICDVDFRDRDGNKMHKPIRNILPVEQTRFVGECIAMVVASTQSRARDAAESVEVEYDELAAVVDTRQAAQPDEPHVWPQFGTNVVVHWEHGNRAEVEQELAAAPTRVAVDLVNNRLAVSPMEPRGALATFDEGEGRVTLYAPTQGGRRIQGIIARVLNLPLDQMRVVSIDTGGGFGIRSKTYPELVLVAYAARKLGRPVKWCGDRSETFLSDYHGRDQVNHAEMGFDHSGKITSLKIETILNVGAYLSENGVRIPMEGGGKIIPCHYHVPNFYMSVTPVFTNTICTDTYRGAGRPEATYIMERLMDLAADACGLDRVEIRRRNFITPDQMPYRTHLGLLIDSGEFEKTMDIALQAADWSTFNTRRAVNSSHGKLRGIGLATFIEAAGSRPIEEMRVRIEPNGDATVFAGTYSHGQGHATVYSQLVHQFLGTPFDRVQLVDGDTAFAPGISHGSFGSRSSMVGGMGIKRACDAIIEKGTHIAARLMQTAVPQVVFEHGIFSAQSSSVTLTEVAAAAWDGDKLPDGMALGLDESYVFESPTENFPSGAHICEVEVDPETGLIKIVNYVAVDDCGIILNPMIVHGQIHGGVMQGLGQALLEKVAYDSEGQLLSASYMDYAMPRADHLPNISTMFSENPSKTNELGVKGAGEAGACGAPAAIVSAVIDALKPFGVRHLDMPLVPERIWHAIDAARSRCTP